MATDTAPTKGNLQQIQKTLRLSENGYDLLDKKRKILVNEISARLQQAETLQDQLRDAVKRAYTLLERATDDIGLLETYNAAQDVAIDDSIRLQRRSIMGTEVAEVKHDATALTPAYAMAPTSVYVDEARAAFNEVKDLYLKLAQLESAAYRLADNIQKTQKRVNALQNITLPDLRQTERVIMAALEEKEREEFIRLKVVKRILTQKSDN